MRHFATVVVKTRCGSRVQSSSADLNRVAATATGPTGRAAECEPRGPERRCGTFSISVALRLAMSFCRMMGDWTAATDSGSCEAGAAEQREPEPPERTRRQSGDFREVGETVERWSVASPRFDSCHWAQQSPRRAVQIRHPTKKKFNSRPVVPIYIAVALHL